MNKYLKLLKYLLIINILCIIISFKIVKIYSTNISKSLLNYINTISKEFAYTYIDSNTSNILSNINQNNIYTLEKNNNNEVIEINYNTKYLNNITSKITSSINKNTKITKLYKIPIYSISNNIFINNLGIKIPIKIVILNNSIASIKTELKEYGLNNALLKVNISIKVNILSVSPISSKEKTITITKPISIKIIEGITPNYYIAK